MSESDLGIDWPAASSCTQPDHTPAFWKLVHLGADPRPLLFSLCLPSRRKPALCSMSYSGTSATCTALRRPWGQGWNVAAHPPAHLIYFYPALCAVATCASACPPKTVFPTVLEFLILHASGGRPNMFHRLLKFLRVLVVWAALSLLDPQRSLCHPHPTSTGSIKAGAGKKQGCQGLDS